MAKKKRVPELRFKGFIEEWEESKFSDIAELRRGLTYKPRDVRADGVRVLRSSNIAEDAFIQREDDIFVNKEAINIDYAQDDDILITSANGSNRLVGKHAVIKNIKSSTVHGGFMLRARTKNPNFLNASMSSRWYSKFISLYVAGGNGAIGNLSKSDLENQDLYLPIELEQAKIGNFFKNIDTNIALHQRKYDKLCILKKSMLEKMFPKEGTNLPEIRFNGFTGKWKRKKIGEVLTEKKRPIELEDSKEYELITVKRRNEGVVSRSNLKGKEILVKNHFKINAGDYLISKRQIVHGANGIVPESLSNAIVSNEYLVIGGNEYITTEFWALISKLPEMYKIFFLSSYGVDIEKLVFDVLDWQKRSIAIPALAEQRMLINFFQYIDSLIYHQQQELNKIKNIKKACLEKMFI